MEVGTMVLEVIAKDDKNVAYFPCNPEHKQNIAFLLIDSNRRVVKTITHQSSGYFS